MTIKKVSEIPEEYNPHMLPVERLVVVIVFLIGAAFVIGMLIR